MKEAFLNRMKTYLTEEEYHHLLACYQQRPQRGLRIHQIEPALFLKKSSIPVEKITYDPDGYYVLDERKYGNHPYHHAGGFYLQEPSAMAPVNLYSFRGDELVLDLCAAPGGKSSQLASRLDKGILLSNDPNPKRSKVLFGNLERLGFSNVVVLNETPERLANQLAGAFDVVLVDAPCSGEGMMRKDEEAEAQWSEELIATCQKRDFDILRAANQLLKENGILIYSTCTFSKEEDEDMVTYLVEQEHYELLPVSEWWQNYTKEGFIPHTRRFYPFTGRGEGQFMAVLQKKSSQATNYRYQKRKNQDSESSLVRAFLEQYLTKTDFDIVKIGNRYYAQCTQLDLTGLNVLNAGIELGEVVNHRFIPYHHLFKALGPYFKNQLILELEDARVAQYIHGEEIEADVPNGYGVIQLDGLYLGGFKAVNGKLKNYYPKGLRGNSNLAG